MPLAAYFRNVGAVLFALLLIADVWLPTSPAAPGGAARSTVIRIHSERKWPEPVIFDTTQAATAAVALAPWDNNPPLPQTAGGMPIDRIDASGIRDTFARLPAPESYRTASVEHRPRPPQKHAARNARKHPKPQFVLAARQGQFTWFGFRYW